MLLPSSFENVIEKADEKDVCVIRSNVLSIEDADKWVKEFGIANDTHWIYRRSKPEGIRFVCR
jgi:hypothetical protein